MRGPTLRSLLKRGVEGIHSQCLLFWTTLVENFTEVGSYEKNRRRSSVLRTRVVRNARHRPKTFPHEDGDHASSGSTSSLRGDGPGDSGSSQRFVRLEYAHSFRPAEGPFNSTSADDVRLEVVRRVERPLPASSALCCNGRHGHLSFGLPPTHEPLLLCGDKARSLRLLRRARNLWNRPPSTLGTGTVVVTGENPRREEEGRFLWAFCLVRSISRSGCPR